MAARKSVEQGLRKRIGNGKSTEIRGDAWLYSDDSGQIITSRPINLSFPDKVADIIDSESGAWLVDLIRLFFWDIDVERILNTLIGSASAVDRFTWAWSKNGKFSVKSCYHYIMQVRDVEAADDGGMIRGLSLG